MSSTTVAGRDGGRSVAWKTDYLARAYRTPGNWPLIRSWWGRRGGTREPRGFGARLRQGDAAPSANGPGYISIGQKRALPDR